MHRRVTKNLYQHILSQIEEDPSFALKALGVCVERFGKCRRLSYATLALSTASQILCTHRRNIPLDEQLDEIVDMICRPDYANNGLTDSIFRAYSDETMTAYMALQETLLGFACDLLQNPDIPDFFKYHKMEKLLDAVPPDHSKRQVIEKIMTDIVENNPKAIHLCPYRHSQMPWEQALTSIFREGIPDIKRYNCLSGMLSLPNGNEEKIYAALEGLWNRHAYDPDFCRHRMKQAERQDIHQRKRLITFEEVA